MLFQVAYELITYSLSYFLLILLLSSYLKKIKYIFFMSLHTYKLVQPLILPSTINSISYLIRFKLKASL
jgi:hypothetical protein